MDLRAQFEEHGVTILEGGCRAVGGAYGSTAFIQEHLNQVLTSLRTKTKAVENATDQGISAQALFLMLKLCVGPSVVHTMRTVSQSQAGHFGRNAKAALRDALYKVLGVERAEQGRLVTETLMFLPGDQGGLGLLDTEWLHSAAYVAAWRQTAETLEPHFSEWSHAEQLARLKKCGKFTANLQDLVARLRRCRNELSAADAEDLVVDELLSGPPKGTQKRLAALLAKERSDALAPSLEDDISRAAFRSAHGSEASSTFSGYYGDGVARLDNNDFRGRALLGIQYPRITLTDDGLCPLCNLPADSAGWHATSCGGIGSAARTKRHTWLERTTTASLESLRAPLVTVTGRENYKDHFALRDASRARADDDGERIVHNDTMHG